MHYVGHLLPKLVEDCNQLLPTGFTFQHTARTAQDWLQANCLQDFIAKDQWPPNSPDLNHLDYYVWGDVGGLSVPQAPSKTKVNHELEEALQVIWDGLPQKPIDKAVKFKSFSKRLTKCVKAGGGHFEHLK